MTKMRNPNGYGGIRKLSGNRRRPWIVEITAGWTDEGKQLRKILGYYATYKEATKALADYNDKPFDIDSANLTFTDIWKLWSAENLSNDDLSKSRKNAYNAAYKAVPPLWDMRFVDIRKNHMQKALDACNKGASTMKNIKILYNQLYKYALANDIVNKNYAEFVTPVPIKPSTLHKPFTADEINLLWDNLGRMKDIDLILIYIYTGLRPSELLDIKTENVFIDERYMRGGSKTEAGKNRIIPIHKRIDPLIRKRYNPANEYLITTENGMHMCYSTLKGNHWEHVMQQLGLEHLPHDARHTFATLMDNVGANKLSTKRILGHASQDITDKFYTHKDIEQLLKDIDLLD